MSSLTRILIFAHDAALYGASLSLLTILEHLSEDKSVDILLVLPYGGKIEERLIAIKINYKIIPFPRCVADKTNSIKRKVFNILKYYKREYKIMPLLEALAMQFKPDLVYTNTSAVSIGYKLARNIHVPHVWHIREFGNLDYQFQYLPFRELVAGRIRNSDTSIFVSKILKKHWVNSEKNNFKVIYNGIISKKLSDNLFKSPTRIFKFGLLGALVPNKGQDIAIRGFSNLLNYYPDCELHFYGDAVNQNFFQNLQKLAAELRCNEKIEFHPFIADNSLIYKDLNVLLNCSAYEGFGRTIVEAMSYGIPVIANASGGNIEIIDDGITGLLYYKTPESLSEKMISLVSDPVLYSRISNNAMIKARKEFSIERYVNEVTSVLKNTQIKL